MGIRNILPGVHRHLKRTMGPNYPDDDLNRDEREAEIGRVIMEVAPTAPVEVAMGVVRIAMGEDPGAIPLTADQS